MYCDGCATRDKHVDSLKAELAARDAEIAQLKTVLMDVRSANFQEMAASIVELRERNRELEAVLRRDDDSVEIRISFKDHHVARTIPKIMWEGVRSRLDMSEYVGRELLNMLERAVATARSEGE